MHRTTLVFVLALSTGLAAISTASPAAPTRTPSPRARTAPAPAVRERGGWPDTPAGEAARRWVEAFDAGEDAMRAFLSKAFSPDALAKRGVEARLETYRTNRERFGRLVLVSVDSSGPTGLRVTLAASDLTSAKYGFFTEASPPYRLSTVLRYDFRSGGHGGFGH